MTTELTKAAQQALEALTELLPDKKDPNHGGHDARDVRKWHALVERLRALTQRPAAQTEREAFLLWWAGTGMTLFQDTAFAAWQARASLPAPQQATPAQHHISADALARMSKRLDDVDSAQPGFQYAKGWNAALRQAMDYAQQATPEPLTLGPLAKRNIYDAIRGAYDLGYNDARNARTVPGDSAPGYDGRSVEEDHGGALFNTLSKRLTPATPEPVGEPHQFPPLPEGWPARFRCDSCDGNGEVGELVSMGHFQPPERQTCPDCGGRGWTSEEPAFNAEHMREFAEAHARCTRPAPGVPGDSELLDYLDTLATRAAGSDLHCFGGRVALYVRTGIGSQIEASGAGTAREAIRAALAAAQAKGEQE